MPWEPVRGLKYKLLYLVIDGVADSLKDPVTTLELAEKPGLDWIASRGVCGLMYTVERGVSPESDEAVISILGYNPHEAHTGRGFLEALGAGLSIKEGFEVAFRANFATIDPTTRKIIDRRVGRNLSTEEAKKLAEALDGMNLGTHGGYVRVVATIGHRAVVVIGSVNKRLSPMVSNNDPAYVRKGLVSLAVDKPKLFVESIVPLDDSEEARITAELANLFFDNAVKILENHPVNEERARRGLPPANAILLRDAGGRAPRATPLNIKYGCKFAVLAEMPVEIGIGKAFGANIVPLEPPTGNLKLDYEKRLDVTLNALEKNDIVYVHLKGPDEPGHDGDLELKKRRVEEIDKYFVRPLLDYADKYAVLVTADHATPPSKRAHTDDPVPVAFYVPGIQPDGVMRFTERDCSKGLLGLIEHGWQLLPLVLNNYLRK
ncbi:MAG: alkaline phosphatase family protein [Desulfurococcaceae archaeon]